MTIYGTLRRATPISFEELRPLLGADEVAQSTTALPDEMVLSISAQRPDAEITINCCVPVQYADAFGGAPELGVIIHGKTSEACEAARSFLQAACNRARITVSTR